MPLHEIQGSLRRCKNHSAEMLQEAIVFLRNELDLSSDEISTGSTMAAYPAKKPVGSNVVIGHGGSALWRELKDFLRDRLNLPVDEFNAVTVAGLPTVERLEGMLNGARFAFLVMTAEDEQPDGKVRARENDVHARERPDAALEETRNGGNEDVASRG